MKLIENGKQNPCKSRAKLFKNSQFRANPCKILDTFGYIWRDKNR